MPRAGKPKEDKTSLKTKPKTTTKKTKKKNGTSK